MKLTERLEKIADLVDKDVRLADIGTDHGYIPVYLLKTEKIPFSILSDINRGPLDNAKEEVEKNGLEEKTQLRLGSGMRVIEKGEVDEVIIAGMGGILISEILEERKDVVKELKKLILQPMQASDELRRYLAENNFRITGEHLVNEDFRIYEIIECVYEENYSGDIESDPVIYKVGRRNIENREVLFKDFIEKKIHECDSIMSKLDGKTFEGVEKRISVVENEKEKLEKILKGEI